ncbi:hypothetical protein DYB38_005443 [Aphanomyces astaci]|uniref:Uncharacterized protein n=2 Tax=Aphanomyces astaci TaxID=112090 RepID=A0A397E777_APHAT|nr:hypothetical protein DYB34_003562 [Aphanomyces astaci]RHY76937.1 hypothetical protein DYB38_005443 [Aphanomyces astaci]
MKRPNPTIRRLSTSSTRFPACHLTPEDEAQYMALSQRLLGRAIAECETTLIDMDSHWKYVRTIPVATSSLKVYKSTHHPSTAFGGAAAQVMATGIVSGTMDDIMTCLSADNSFAFRMNSALLMPKEHLDCEVLHTIVPLPTSSPTSSSTSDKFRFLGLKWGATKWPSASKHRDLCYLESTGVTRTSDTQGHVMEYGYCLMESIDLPAICPPLDQFSIKRVKVSLRHVFRTLPIGCTLVMSHCSIDLGSHASPSTMWMPPDLTTFPHLVSIAAAAEVATAIRLSNALLLRHPTTADNSTTWNVPEFLRKFPRECALCHHKSDRLQKHRVVNLLGSTGIKIVAQFFCHACAMPPATPPATSPSSATSPPSPLGPVIRPRPAPTMPLAPFSEMQSRAAKRHITQETFNECVRENMEEFDMIEEDAIADAVTQFESQGVDLSTIVKALDVVHPVLAALKVIEADESDDETCLHVKLVALQDQFKDAVGSSGAKELAGQINGPTILLQRLPAVQDVATRILLLSTLQSMVRCRTQIFLEVQSNDRYTQTAAFSSLKCICAKNEVNKKRLTSHGIIARLVVLFRDRSMVPDGRTKDIADVIRVLTLHDDTTSMFSQTHDIVKLFVEHGVIDAVLPYLRGVSSDPDTLSSWLAVVKQLAITEDTCRKLVAAGILDLLPTFQQHAHHPTEVYLQTLGCATIAAICLRSPANCDRAVQMHAHRAIGLAMVGFPDNVALLRQASLAIRNMVVRNEQLRPIVLEDVERHLRAALPLRGCGDEAYAALRDLGADVPLASIGTRESANFNPVMVSSNQLVEAIQDNATAPFGEFD